MDWCFCGLVLLWTGVGAMLWRSYGWMLLWISAAVTWWFVRLAVSVHVKVLQGSHHGPGQAWGCPRTWLGTGGQ